MRFRYPSEFSFRNLIQQAWALRFGLESSRQRRILTDALCSQLCKCRDDSARRLLLGVSQ